MLMSSSLRFAFLVCIVCCGRREIASPSDARSQTVASRSIDFLSGISWGAAQSEVLRAFPQSSSASESLAAKASVFGVESTIWLHIESGRLLAASMVWAGDECFGAADRISLSVGPYQYLRPIGGGRAEAVWRRADLAVLLLCLEQFVRVVVGPADLDFDRVGVEVVGPPPRDASPGPLQVGK
jgi:hypothetical protein